MKKEKKERFTNWAFTIVLFYLILPWQGIISRLVDSTKQEMNRPFISQELFDQKWKEVLAIFDQAKGKGKEYAAPDYAQGITKIHFIQTDLETKYRFDKRQTIILSKWKDDYGKLRERIRERNQSTGGFSMLALSQAMNQARQEAGMDGIIYTVVTKARIVKFLKWIFLFAWPVSLFPVLLLYIRRCQIREISFKELMILSPLKFLGCWIFGLIGLMMNYPGNDMAGLRRYLKLKNAYTRDKSWRHWLNKDEEAKLWQQARMPLERFDQRLQQTLAYSRVVAFVSSLFIWIFIAPLRSLAGQAQKEQPVATAKVTPKDEQKKKSIIAEFFDINNFKFTGLVQFKALATAGKDFSFDKRIHLDAKGGILSWGKFRVGYAGKVDLTKTDPTLPYASLEIVPGFKFIDKICLGRIIDVSLQALPPFLITTIEFPFHAGFPTDLGISLAGHIGQFNWALARFDGNGGRLLWKDPNKAKDLVANLTWSSKSFLGLKAFNWRTVYRGGDEIAGGGKRCILGSDISLTKGKVTVEGGLVKHRESAKNLDGGWLLGFATFGKWQPLFQYDFQKEKGGRLTAGLNFLVDKSRRIQLNVEKIALGTRWRVQYQVGF